MPRLVWRKYILDAKTRGQNSTSSANFAGVVKNDGFDGNIGIEKNSEEIVSPLEKEIVKTCHN